MAKIIMKNPRLHTAEHILWQVLKNKLRELKTRALQFTNDYCRFDFITYKQFSQKELKEITEIVNEIIDRNLKVTIETFSREKAERMVDLSLIPENIDPIRIVKIGDFSIEACGGEHVKNTSEIGKFQIIEYKKIGKSTFRIKFKLK